MFVVGVIRAAPLPVQVKAVDSVWKLGLLLIGGQVVANTEVTVEPYTSPLSSRETIKLGRVRQLHIHLMFSLSDKVLLAHLKHVIVHCSKNNPLDDQRSLRILFDYFPLSALSFKGNDQVKQIVTKLLSARGVITRHSPLGGYCSFIAVEDCPEIEDGLAGQTALDTNADHVAIGLSSYMTKTLRSSFHPIASTRGAKNEKFEMEVVLHLVHRISKYVAHNATNLLLQIKWSAQMMNGHAWPPNPVAADRIARMRGLIIIIKKMSGFVSTQGERSQPSKLDVCKLSLNLGSDCLLALAHPLRGCLQLFRDLASSVVNAPSPISREEEMITASVALSIMKLLVSCGYEVILGVTTSLDLMSPTHFDVSKSSSWL
jgi:hypothetical protein